MIIDFSDIRERNSIKVGLATLIATWISLYFDVPNPFLAGTVAILSFSYQVENTLGRISDRLIGTVLGALYGLSLAPWFANDHILLLTLIFVTAIITILGFLHKGGLWLNFGICAFLIFALTIDAPSAAWTVAVWRIISVIIGIVVVIVIDNLVGIDSLSADYQESHNSIIQSVTDFIATPSVDNIGQLSQRLKKLSSIYATYASISKEKYTHKYELLSEHSMHLANELFKFIDQDIPEDLKQDFASALMTLSTIPGQQTLIPKLDDFTKTVTQYKTSTTDPNEYVILMRLLSVIKRIHAIYTLKSTWHAQSEKYNNLRHYLKKRTSQYIVMLNNRPDLIEHAIKVGIAVVLVTFLWTYTDWYGGVCAVLTVLATGSDASLEKIKMKASLRFWGTVVGFLIGTFFLVFFITNVYTLLFVIGIVSYSLAYIAYSGFKQMYFAWMACMSFAITVVSYNYMVETISFSAERVASMILAWAVVYFVMSMILPTTIQKQKIKKTMRLRKNIASTLIFLSNIKNLPHDQIHVMIKQNIKKLNITIRQILEMNLNVKREGEINQLIMASLELKSLLFMLNGVEEFRTIQNISDKYLSNMKRFGELLENLNDNYVSNKGEGSQNALDLFDSKTSSRKESKICKAFMIMTGNICKILNSTYMPVDKKE